MVILEHKKKRGLCVSHGCTSPPTERDRFCAKHSKKWQRLHNPLAYCFANLKQNAKRRGKDFGLTIDQFKKFCEDTNYLKLKGKGKKSASIDRIDPNRGYFIDNIQILSLSDNASKGMGGAETAPF